MATIASSGTPATRRMARSLKIGALISIQERYSPSSASPKPRTAIIVPSVTITGLMRSPSMRSAFRSPTRAPAPIAAAIATSGCRSSVRDDSCDGRGQEHDGADGEVNASDQHHERHAEAENQHRGRLARDVLGICRASRRPAKSARTQGTAGSRRAASRARRGATPRSAGCDPRQGARPAAGTAPLIAVPWTRRFSRSSSVSAGRVSATIAPSRTTRMRSASASTSGMSEDTTMTALAGVGQRIEPPVDLGARRDIDAACRVDKDEEVGVGEVPARDQRLLLVAAGERADRRRERARDDAEVLFRARHGTSLRRAVDESPAEPPPPERGEGDIRRERQVRKDALLLAVVGREGRSRRRPHCADRSDQGRDRRGVMRPELGAKVAARRSARSRSGPHRAGRSGPGSRP